MIVRSDLPIGFLAAQIVHAAGESSVPNLEPGTHAVVLSVRTEAARRLIARQLQKRGIRHVAIHEPDPPYCGALTAIGLAPVRDRADVKPVLSKLSLFARTQAPKTKSGPVV